MAKETSVNATNAIAQLVALGAAKTEIVLVQHDPNNNIFDCSLIARGYDASGNQLGQDKLLCPSPCKISQALNPNA